MTTKKESLAYDDFNFYLFLDIDEVLQPTCAKYHRSKAWPDYEYVDSAQRHIYSKMMIAELNDFIREYKPTVYMVTSWEERAEAFCKKIGLEGAEGRPWLNAIRDVNGIWGKFHSVINMTTTSGVVAPAIWIDDDLMDEHEASLWAAENDVLALAPSTDHGITRSHLVQMRKYAERLRWEKLDSRNAELVNHVSVDSSH